MPKKTKSPSVEALLAGQVPQDPAVAASLTAGVSFLSDFLREEYLKQYIPQGGSKMKFVTGRPGSGKTHLATLLLAQGEAEGYLTVRFSAKDVLLHDFREVYLEILRQCGIDRVMEGLAMTIIREMGEDPAKIPEGKTFLDYLAMQGEADALSKGAIRQVLREKLLGNPSLDNNFSLCCSLLAGNLLGYPVLENASRDRLVAFLSGDKTIKLSQLRSLGLSPTRINKYNARNLLRSLCEVVRIGGFKGILVCIDDMEVLISKPAKASDAQAGQDSQDSQAAPSPLDATTGQTQQNPVKYTKQRREDTYESIRQLIDDIDTMRYLMFFLCMDRELLDNERAGLKSYQALWMRIQSEVMGGRFNRFADIIDLDHLSDQVYTPEVVVEMGEKLSAFLKEAGVPAGNLDLAAAEELIKEGQFSAYGLPHLVNRFVVEGGKDNG